MKINVAPLEKAIAQLEENLALIDSDIATGNPALQRALERGAIQAFEFTHTLAVGLLKRQMEQVVTNPDELETMNIKDLFRTASDKGLIPDVDRFFDYQDKRNDTSHHYDEAFAQTLLSILPPFVRDSHFLLDKLREHNR